MIWTTTFIVDNDFPEWNVIGPIINSPLDTKSSLNLHGISIEDCLNKQNATYFPQRIQVRGINKVTSGFRAKIAQRPMEQRM